MRLAYDQSEWNKYKLDLRDRLLHLETYDIVKNFKDEIEQFRELLDKERQERIEDD